MIFETKGAVHFINQAYHTLNLLFDLLRRHKNMCVILCEATHAHQAVQRSGKLMAVNQPQLANTQGQVTIGV